MTLDEIIAQAGGVTKLARIAGVDRTTISSGWRMTGRIPVRHVRAVSEALKIPPHQIRPDVWSACEGAA